MHSTHLRHGTMAVVDGQRPHSLVLAVGVHAAWCWMGSPPPPGNRQSTQQTTTLFIGQWVKDAWSGGNPRWQEHNTKHCNPHATPFARRARWRVLNYECLNHTSTKIHVYHYFDGSRKAGRESANAAVEPPHTTPTQPQ
jgi:hypothetical protein